MTTNFQLLMLSPNLQNPIMGVGGGVGDQLSKVNFKLSNLSPKLKFPFLGGGGDKWNEWNLVLTSFVHLG